MLRSALDCLFATFLAASLVFGSEEALIPALKTFLHTALEPGSKGAKAYELKSVLERDVSTSSLAAHNKSEARNVSRTAALIPGKSIDPDMVPQSLTAHHSNPKGLPAKAPPSRKPKAPAKATAQDKMRGVPPEAYPQEEMPCHLVQFPIVATRHLFQKPSARPSAGAANASLTPEALSLRSGSRSGSSRRLSGSHHHHHNLKSGPQGGGGSRGRGPGSSGGEDEDPLLLWQSGTDAMGNAMLGFLTTYWDAMRAGRRLVASRYGMIQVCRSRRKVKANKNTKR